MDILILVFICMRFFLLIEKHGNIIHTSRYVYMQGAYTRNVVYLYYTLHTCTNKIFCFIPGILEGGCGHN
jgi:hypothetical protein